MTVYACFRFYFEVPSQFIVEMPARPLERGLVFPMAVVPNIWGFWNMLYLAVRSQVPHTPWLEWCAGTGTFVFSFQLSDCQLATAEAKILTLTRYTCLWKNGV
jgi:hypothetical protein